MFQTCLESILLKISLEFKPKPLGKTSDFKYQKTLHITLGLINSNLQLQIIKKRTLPGNCGGFNRGWEWCNIVGVLLPQLCQLWERKWGHRINSLKNKSKNAKSEAVA
jgi:hypothetical protein